MLCSCHPPIWCGAQLGSTAAPCFAHPGNAFYVYEEKTIAVAVRLFVALFFPRQVFSQAQVYPRGVEEEPQDSGDRHRPALPVPDRLEAAGQADAHAPRCAPGLPGNEIQIATVQCPRLIRLFISCTLLKFHSVFTYLVHCTFEPRRYLRRYCRGTPSITQV